MGLTDATNEVSEASISATHMFASEYGESTLSEKGSGEFEPSFVITKLGSRVNRVIVAGLLERIEGRDVANGSVIYQGQLRDPSGINYFSVGDYVSDSVKEMTIQLSARLESGEPVLVLMVAKTGFTKRKRVQFTHH